MYDEMLATREKNDLTDADIARVENIVKKRWLDSDENEAQRLVDIMKVTPSKYWIEMLAKAERHDIQHWKLLLHESGYLYEIAAEALADEDGLVAVEKKKG